MISHTQRDGAKTIVQIIADEGTTLESLAIVGLGEARCRPDDAYSREVGELIAMGRAIQDYGRQVEAVGDAKCLTIADLEKALDYLGEQVGSADFNVAVDDEATTEEEAAALAEELLGQLVIATILGQEEASLHRAGA